MATWDFGGGCLCGVSKVCDCKEAPAPLPMFPSVQPKVKSDGGSTDYYKLPSGATDLIDLIEHKKMSFSLGNIFKACYRLGEKEGNDLLYDLNKIIFFAERMKKEIENNR